MMKNDIQNRKDIRKLVGTFYEKLLKDEVFNYIFLEVAKVDVLEHMDIIIDFWESALFQAGKYKDDLIEVHLNLNQQFNYGLNKEHFNTMRTTSPLVFIFVSTILFTLTKKFKRIPLNSLNS